MFLLQHIIVGWWSHISAASLSHNGRCYKWPGMEHAVILECMQRNQEVLQACWNLKNCSQAGCGLAGFLHNCWYWVVRLAVMVARGVGGLQRSLPAFSNRDIHWHRFWFNEHWNVQLQGYVCFPDLRIFEVCEQHALNSDNQRRWYFLRRVIIFFLKNTCAVYVCSISVLHTPP